MIEYLLRVGIIGGPGSGKSWFAEQLGALWGVVPTELDQLRLIEGWGEIPPEETRIKILKTMKSPQFILDGNFTKFGEDLLDMVSSIIWLDLPMEECRDRVYLRSKEQMRTGETFHNGNHQTPSSMRRLIRKCQTKHQELRETMPDLLKRHHFLRLKSNQAVEATLAAFKKFGVCSSII